MLKEEGSIYHLKHKTNKPGNKKVKPKNRFRAVVRRVIHNLDWLVDLEEDDVNNLQAKMNLIILRTKKKQDSSSLGLVEKSILMRDPDLRTEEEKRRICFVISGMKCFRRYSEVVQRRLAAVTYFQYYGPQRVVVRQGHEAENLYFIMDGEVIVTVRSPDPMTGRPVDKEVGKMGNGEMFGEVSLLHNIPRTATITTSANCNLLCLKRKDFETILKVSMIAQWEESRRAIRNIPYFHDWSTVSVRECCILSRIQKYETNETIMGDGIGQSAYVYYVISGECQMIETMRVVVRYTRDDVIYRMYDPHRTRVKKGERLETFFMQVCRLKMGACFNIGEHLGSRTLLATSPVKCLIVPRYWVLQNNQANIWNRVVSYLDSTVPTSLQIFQDFQEERRWMRYKQQLVVDNVNRHPRSNITTIHDVPYSIRMSQVNTHNQPGYQRKRNIIPDRMSVNPRKSYFDETPILIARHNSSVY